MSKFTKFGIEVEDKVSKIKGIITGKCSYLTGCDQYIVQPKGDVLEQKNSQLKQD